IGRASSGTGPAEEIDCTAAARTFLAAVDVDAQRAALGITPISPLTPIPPVVREFTSSGTYTPTEGMTYCRIRVQAPGGGGGGGDGNFVSGGGGGGGEYAEGFFTADD